MEAVVEALRRNCLRCDRSRASRCEEVVQLSAALCFVAAAGREAERAHRAPSLLALLCTSLLTAATPVASAITVVQQQGTEGRGVHGPSNTNGGL